MGTLYLSLSHKGGTGRSVTTSNVAYRLAERGHHVCVVDLDLDSPTLGAVLQVGGMELGFEDGDGRGIARLLASDDAATDPTPELIEVWRSEHLRGVRTETAGRFDFLPGSRGVDYALDSSAMSGRLDRIVASLESRYDFIFCDLRSGTSRVAEAFAAPRLSERIAAWLLFFRWTPQHMAGLRGLVEAVGGAEQPYHLIRTAYLDPGTVEDARIRQWVRDRDADISRELESIDPGRRHLIGSVPLETLLQWSEQIVTRREVERGVAASRTHEAFESLADVLERQPAMAR